MSDVYPDPKYRPIPMVWFAGAFMVQAVALFVTFFALYALSPGYTVIASGLITLLVVRWTWRRGMREAAWGWKCATIALLAFNFALVSIGAQDRIPFRDPPGPSYWRMRE